MRARSQPSSIPHSRFKAAWVTLAAGSLAGLAVLGACSDGPAASKIGGADIPAVRFDNGVVGALSHKVQVCVHLDSDPAPGNVPYTFVGVAKSEAAPPNPWFERKMTDAEVAAEQAYVTGVLGFTSNSYGPFNALTDNDVVTTNPSTTAGNCADVFVRQNYCPGLNCTGDPGEHGGNRMWTTPAGVQNKFATVGITANVPPGYTFTLACANDDDGNPLNCVDGGYASANVFHGSNFTYKFTAPTDLPCPAGSFTTSVAGAAHVDGWPDGGVGDLLIKYDQFPAPNDNSYGDNSIGWKPNRAHRFKDLVNSDHAGILLKNAAGQTRLSFDMDYLSAFSGAPSGYKSLGVTGGDGQMRVGTADGISVTTSLANNLNNINIPGLFNPATHVQLKGSVNVKEDSPPTDPAHQTYVISDAALGPSATQAGWDFHNTYYARISLAKLTALGFNAATWTVAPNASALHNSPPKACPNQED